MSPRPQATRHDDEALLFLNAGARLIDEVMSGTRQAPRLKHLHYPPALDWIRVEDVLRIVRDESGGDRSKAFRNRWPNRDEYLRDVFMYALLYRDSTGYPVADRQGAVDDLHAQESEVPRQIKQVATQLLDQLITSPRSCLMAHAAPMVAADPEVQRMLGEAIVPDQQFWIAQFDLLLASTGTVLRTGWSTEQLNATIQMILDGAVIRNRLGIPLPSGQQWQVSSIASDAIVALIAAVVDFERDGLTVEGWFFGRFEASKADLQQCDAEA